MAALEKEEATNEFSDANGKTHHTIVALTGNFYVTAHTDDTDYSDTEKTGLVPENYAVPLDCANIEPAEATDEYIAKTCARECGLGEISVRGIGVRVAVAVLASNGYADGDSFAIAKSSGGDS